MMNHTSGSAANWPGKSMLLLCIDGVIEARTPDGEL
jgi:hypothetical protein